MPKYCHPALKLLQEFETRKGVYIIQLDTAERLFIPFQHPNAQHQLVVSSLCTHIKSAIQSQAITFGEFRQKYPNISEYIERMRGCGFRTF